MEIPKETEAVFRKALELSLPLQQIFICSKRLVLDEHDIKAHIFFISALLSSVIYEIEEHNSDLTLNIIEEMRKQIIFLDRYEVKNGN